jgi:hypothetical protein
MGTTNVNDDLPKGNGPKLEITVPEGERYTPLMAAHLKNTRPWVLFAAILMIVSCASLALGGVTMTGLGACMGSRLDTMGLFRGLTQSVPFIGAIYAGLGIFYLILSGIYIPLFLYLLRFARSIRSLLTTGKTEHLEAALGHQRAYWKYTGIMAIVGIAVAMVAGVIAVIAVMAAWLIPTKVY